MYAGAGGVFAPYLLALRCLVCAMRCRGCRYTATEQGLKGWTPRQIKAIDEAEWRLCLLEEEEEVLPRTGVSRWCECVVTSSARVDK